MGKYWIVLASAIFTGWGSAQADAGEQSRVEFHLAIEQHYQTTPDTIAAFKAKGTPDEDLPVVFCLASKARVKPGAILDLRIKGKSWMEITAHFGLGADLFYVSFPTDPGPPYGKAYGYYKKTPKHRWHEIVLSDVEVVELVNLSFMAKHYQLEPHSLVKMRIEGSSYLSINVNLKSNKKNGANKSLAKQSAKPAKKQAAPASKGKGKGKGKKKK